MRRDVFQAIADPNRRAILSLLAEKRMTLNGVAENFRISRPAVSKHIKILKECGLVVVIPQGRERYVEARFDRLGEVSDWIEKYRQVWEAKFDRLDKVLENMKKEK
ncbi:MAG: metalloregulator ArsR/SmtB family transcription factor [Anaerolineales bacterium]|jgi:DNA-binding transcriptional ArsR family regulator|nr:MAG: metalloregulator ArsR/SmtB family transcription factor [Anaerolineales bacterium]